MQSLLILGRQPSLGLAELESIYGSEKVRSASSAAAILNVDPCLVAFERLGGSVKFCKVLTVLKTTDWNEIENFLIDVSPEHSQAMPEGKMTLGLSLYEFKLSNKRIEATGLKIKKAIRNTGRPVRLVPNKSLELNSAQVIHNKLTGENGWELIFVKDGDETIIAQTIKVQDLESYTMRDRGRPKRDPRVGMLPPKLAQIIINLATGLLPEEKLESICLIPAGEMVPRPSFQKVILDPFCGTGVVLQEARLMGYDIMGTDLETRMVEYTKTNLEWLKDEYNLEELNTIISVGDATKYKWEHPLDFVACETYLGRPFTSLPTQEILEQTVTECNIIIKKFLQNIHDQLKPGTRLCIAVPAWNTKSKFVHLPLIDQLNDLGYNRLSFERVRNEQLLYYREDQIVARELLVLITH